MKKRIPNTVVYARCSSSDQTTASQLPDLHKWIASNKPDALLWQEHYTGTTLRRPLFDELLREIRAGKVRTVVVWRLDRLGRTAAGLTALFEEWGRLGCNLISLRDGLDLSTPAGRLMANVLASVAQYETEVRRERQRAGIDAAVSRGQKLGGSKKGRRLRVTEEKEEVISRCYREGMRIAAIARTVDLHRDTVRQVIARLGVKRYWEQAG